MKLGTAKITEGLDHKGKFYAVMWTNVGNFLRNEPRWFNTRDEAERFCRDHGIQVTQ